MPGTVQNTLPVLSHQINPVKYVPLRGSFTNEETKGRSSAQHLAESCHIFSASPRAQHYSRSF